MWNLQGYLCLYVGFTNWNVEPIKGLSVETTFELADVESAQEIANVESSLKIVNVESTLELVDVDFA